MKFFIDNEIGTSHICVKLVSQNVLIFYHLIYVVFKKFYTGL